MMSGQRGAATSLILATLLIVLLLGAAALIFIGQRGNAASELNLHSASAQAASVALSARAALRGDPKALSSMKQANRVLPDVEELRTAADTGGLDADAMVGQWRQLGQGISGFLKSEASVMERLNIQTRSSRALDQMLTATDEITASLSGAQQAGFANIADRLISEVSGLKAGLRADKVDLAAIDNSLSYVSGVSNALDGNVVIAGVPQLTGAESLDQLAKLQTALDTVSNDIGALELGASGVANAHQAANQIENASSSIHTLLAPLRSSLSDEASWWQAPQLPLLLLVGSLLSALGYMRSKRGAAEVVEVPDTDAVELADKHQEAILRLLDEMGDLADGDLTVEATVTEDITGAIADSINYAIEALRELVSTIDGAAESVDSAAKQTRASANHLAKASEDQSRQVASATESISNMAASIEAVSTNAERSSTVARHSVEIAHKGGEAVRRTIDGMNTIRETIQDTSKRIKRLGESSQEIGNIVELINDIAEQTNILALNASIQASMAGEAGRGFGVVADEVQRLAERSTNATKQIEVLVKTIQADTNEAVVSMERSTTDVVSGALLAENAGAALDEIEKVSNQIASLVQNISGSAREQAGAAGNVTSNMSVLQEISAQTAESTGATSQSIGKLAEMAAQLRRSVAGFTLPKEVDISSKADEIDDDDTVSHLVAIEENEFIDTLIVKKEIAPS